MTSKKVDVKSLEETMEEVVETLDLAEQAAEFVQAQSLDPADRARAAAVQKRAEAMLDAAEEHAAAEYAAERHAAEKHEGDRSGRSLADGRRPDTLLH